MERERAKQNKTKKTKQNRNDKKKGTITKYTCHKKIGEGHSIERVWYNASRELSDTLPGSQPCIQTRSVYMQHSKKNLNASRPPSNSYNSMGYRLGKTSIHGVTNPARGLLYKEKRTKEKAADSAQVSSYGRETDRDLRSL